MWKGLGKLGFGGLLWMVDLVLAFVTALSEDDCSVDCFEKCSEECSVEDSEDVQCSHFVAVR